MIINVKVIPKSSRIKVTQDGQNCKVHLTKPAVDGQANEQLVEVLAEHFKTKKYNILILKGDTGRNKIIQIDE